MNAPSRHEEKIGAVGRDLAVAMNRFHKAEAHMRAMGLFSSYFSDEEFVDQAREYADADEEVREALLCLKTWIKGERDGNT